MSKQFIDKQKLAEQFAKETGFSPVNYQLEWDTLTS